MGKRPRTGLLQVIRETIEIVMRMFVMIGSALVFAAIVDGASAKSDDIEIAGQVVAFGLPAAAGAYSIFENDKIGLAELSSSWLLSVGTTYGLSHVIREARPDHSDFHSFPSNTAASAFSAANYFWGRYGWEYGVPAYALAIFAGYSRVQANQHHWYDVAASGVIALGINYAIVTRYRRSDAYNIAIGASPDSVEARFSYRW